jgi:hypothetical protein
VPASVANGDIIVIPMFLDSTATISAMASGFAHAEGSPISIVGGGAHSLAVVWKRASGSDTGTYDFTLSGSTYVEGAAARYTGAVAAGNPWDSPTGTASDNTNGTVSPPVSVTTAGPDRMLVFASTNWSGGNWTPPSGFNERMDTGAQIVTLDDLVQATQGGSGTVQATCAGSDKRTAWLGALIGTTVSGSIPWTPPRPPQFRDSGAAWWLQRDRTNANLVATAADPLVSPLDTAFARYWHVYNDTAVRDRRFVPQQRSYISDPSLLGPAVTDPLTLAAGVGGDTWRRYNTPAYADRREVPQQRVYVSGPALLLTALLENELLGEAETGKRYGVAASHALRWWMPRQPKREGYTPGLLDSAELENELLGGAETVKRHLPATHVDRREVPQQRAYISDPSSYPTVPPTDPLTVAWGGGGAYWTLYNTAAIYIDRRQVPQQRRYISDPRLLLTALLENELLGGADDRWRHYGQLFVDRREVPQQRAYVSDPTLLVAVLDPLTVAQGVGGDTWRRYNTPAYADRREVPQQPVRQTLYFDAGPDLPPLTLAWGAGGALWHVCQWRREARSWWQPRPVFTLLGDPCTTLRPTTGLTVHPSTGTTSRPSTGITEDSCN